MSDTPWSPQQDFAVREVRAWLKNPRGKQVFRLFGFAGTGKTTLAKILAQEVKGFVEFACYMGKAALVLRSKGCDGAGTVHSLIYKAFQDQVTGQWHFALDPHSKAARASLIVIDEGSQIDDDMAADVLSYGVKVLVLADPFQLPPIKGTGYFTDHEPDVMLTEIHRQAADNPIIRMSMDIREGRGLSLGSYGDSRVIEWPYVDPHEMKAMYLDHDQVLCGLNKTRTALNSRIRKARGLQGEYETWHPTVGDKLVCLRNNRVKGLLNGSLWEVDNLEMRGDLFHITAASLDQDDRLVTMAVREEFFNGTEKNIPWKELKGLDEATFGEALTTHKFQGSQADDVMIFNEGGAFEENADRWLYTAVTRAAERVTVLV